MIFKIIFMGICVCILSVILKQYQPSFVIILELAFAVIVILIIYDEASQSIKSILEIFNSDGTSEKIFSCLLKGALVCIATKLACDVSKENGNLLIADIIEISGRIMLLIISFPFIESIINTALSFAS